MMQLNLAPREPAPASASIETRCQTRGAWYGAHRRHQQQLIGRFIHRIFHLDSNVCRRAASGPRACPMARRHPLASNRARVCPTARENSRRTRISIDIELMPDTDAFIHRFIPVGKKSPVLLLLHGTGGNEDDLLLGSGGFSAQLAGELGLPFASAGHFSPDNILPALELYRRSFRPSENLSRHRIFRRISSSHEEFP